MEVGGIFFTDFFPLLLSYPDRQWRCDQAVDRRLRERVEYPIGAAHDVRLQDETENQTTLLIMATGLTGVCNRAGD